MVEEAALITMFLAVVLLTELALSKSFWLFSRNLWLDEIVTLVLVSDRSVLHSLTAIAGGVDTNPPAYHLLLRVFRLMVGHGGEATLRTFSLLSVLAALVGLYLNLRQVYLPLSALAAVLAVSSHPLLVECAFDARMYGPWFAAVVWFAYLLSRTWNTSAALWLWVLLGCSSVLTCALHTLGALSVALVLSAHLLFHLSGRWDWLAIGWASLGLFAFLGWIPILWKQNDANPVTWVKLPTKRRIAAFAHRVLIPESLATVFVLSGGLSAFLPGSSRMVHGPSDLTMLAGLAGLIVLPLGLVALSYAVQPLTVARYATPTVASFAPAFASLVSPLPTPWTAALCGLLVVIGARYLSNLRDQYWTRERRTTELIQAILKHAGHEPVLFETLHDLSVVSRYAESVAQRCYTLDCEAGQVSCVDDVRIANCNQARVLSGFYAGYRMMPWESARRLPKLYLVTPAIPALEHGSSEFETRYPGFRAVHVEASLFALIRA
jgi:hypothetical protein